MIGGEGNGGVIDPRVGWVRDPFIGMGLILNLMAETGKKLSELVAELPAYHIVKDKYTLPAEDLPSSYDALTERAGPKRKPNQLDGLRLDWPDRWVHVRPSNTEPIVRVIAERRTQLTRRSCAARWGRFLHRTSHPPDAAGGRSWVFLFVQQSPAGRRADEAGVAAQLGVADLRLRRRHRKGQSA